MVKPEKFDHLLLVYYFTVPLKTLHVFFYISNQVAQGLTLKMV